MPKIHPQGGIFVLFFTLLLVRERAFLLLLQLFSFHTLFFSSLYYLLIYFIGSDGTLTFFKTLISLLSPFRKLSRPLLLVPISQPLVSPAELPLPICGGLWNWQCFGKYFPGGPVLMHSP